MRDNMLISIGQVYIKNDEEGGVSRLCADISGINDDFTLYYEVDKKYKSYLCIERADCFLIGILPYAMAHSRKDDIMVVKCVTPISEQLYYQLTVHYIPTLTDSIDWYNNIKIECKTEHNILPSANAVCVGASGGVDSWYTILKSNENTENYKITHGVYLDYDSNEKFYGDPQNARRNMVKNICIESGIEFINIKSNICHKIYHIAHEAIVACMLLSYFHAVSKLFKIVFYSSTYKYTEFAFKNYSSEFHQLFNTSFLSTENLSIYTPGSDVERYRKTAYIANYELPRKYLSVCLTPSAQNGVSKNCSKCAKCTITMIDLDLAGKLDLFSDVFDVEAYRKDRNYYWGYLVFKGKKDTFVKETFELMKNKKIKFPLSARIAGIKKIIKKGFKRGNPIQYTYRP